MSDHSGPGVVDNETTVIEPPKTIQQRPSTDLFSTEKTGIGKLSNEKMKSMTKSDDESIQYGKTLVRIMKLARPEWLMLAVASVAALLIGISIPMFSILFAELFGVSLAILLKSPPFER